MPLTHIVLFRIRPDADPAAVERLITEAREKLPQIPGVSELHAGWVIQRDSPYQVGLSMRLPDEAALEAYRVHPLHVEYVERVLEPVRESRLAIDIADER